MGSKVYFAERRATSGRKSLTVKLGRLFDRVGFENVLEAGELVAVKLHFGERGLTTFLNPVFVRIIVERLLKQKVKPFLTDTNTLYIEGRHNAVDHLHTAMQHGFSYATTEAPIIIADGLRGLDSKDVPLSGKHFETVKIAQGILNADSMIALSHVKGHVISGLGGAIKNLSMGCSSRAGKHMMHADMVPEVIEEKCRGDANCVHHCPAHCITMVNKKALIDREQCIGCGECVAACPHEAIKVDWSKDGDLLQERMAEFALGAVQDKREKCCFINFLMDITPHCDCHDWSDSLFVPDIGILASFDPVAIDQASVDLINGQHGLANSKLSGSYAPGEDKFANLFPGCDYTRQLTHAENLGIGSREYELIKVG